MAAMMTSASAADTFQAMPMNLYLLTSANEGSKTRAIVQPIPPTDGDKTQKPKPREHD